MYHPTKNRLEPGQPHLDVEADLSPRRMALGLAWCLGAFVVVAQTPARAEDPVVPCEQVQSIGAATMDANRVITMRIRSLPPGPIAEGTFTYKPGGKDYQSIIDHLGGIAPGQTKSVKPWC